MNDTKSYCEMFAFNLFQFCLFVWVCVFVYERHSQRDIVYNSHFDEMSSIFIVCACVLVLHSFRVESLKCSA